MKFLQTERSLKLSSLLIFFRSASQSFSSSTSYSVFPVYELGCWLYMLDSLRVIHLFVLVAGSTSTSVSFIDHLEQFLVWVCLNRLIHSDERLVVTMMIVRTSVTAQVKVGYHTKGHLLRVLGYLCSTISHSLLFPLSSSL